MKKFTEEKPLPFGVISSIVIFILFGLINFILYNLLFNKISISHGLLIDSMLRVIFSIPSIFLMHFKGDGLNIYNFWCKISIFECYINGKGYL